MRSTIYFTQEIPDLGSRINVTESAARIEILLRVAGRGGDLTISVTKAVGRSRVLIPVALIGAVVEDR